MSARSHFVRDRNTMEHYFYFERLDSESALQTCYALRYQVYCQECKFLPEADYPNQIETDEYDGNSVHFGAYHVAGDFAGTVRLALGTMAELPFAPHCVVDPASLPAGATTAKVGEISRLAVSRKFRRRNTDGVLPDQYVTSLPPSELSGEHRRNFPELIMGLYKAMYQETKRQGIEFWFAAMEQSLTRMLRRFNFSFQPVGPEIDYYGPVTPYIARITELEAEVFRVCPELLIEMAEGLEPELVPVQVREALAVAPRGVLCI